MINWVERQIPSESDRGICLKLFNDWLKLKNKQYLSKMTSKSPKTGREKLIFSPQGPETLTSYLCLTFLSKVGHCLSPRPVLSLSFRLRS